MITVFNSFQWLFAVFNVVPNQFSPVFNSYSIPLPPAQRAIDFPKCGRCFAGLVCEFAPAAPAQ